MLQRMCADNQTFAGQVRTRLPGQSHDTAVVPLLQHHRRLQQLAADAKGGRLEDDGQVLTRRLDVALLPTAVHSRNNVNTAGR